MSQIFLHDASFHLFLNKIDQEFVEEAKEQRCPCGGHLHQADYPRSPMGIPTFLRQWYEKRFSLCCDQCRKRTTPMSVRFFGRRWFPAPWLAFLSILTLGINERRLAQVKRYLGMTISESTWKRWRRWWRESFVITPFWQQTKGLLVTTSQSMTGPFPRVLFDLFQGKGEAKLMSLLRLLAPLTAGVLRAV